ncbi:hypothetical protein LUZ60_012716 [Juncus effusus]|nr:hypothetical protein LUZ60_012716 [Juncus effusus]
MGWESLPADLAAVVAGRISGHADYIRFRAVCSAWRSATAGRPDHLPRQLPFLLLPGKTFTFRSPSENRSYFIPFPTGAHCQILGSSHGWLFLMGPTTNLWLLNPFARSMISLPPVVEMPNLFELVTPSDVEKYRAAMDRRGNRPTLGFWKYLVHKGKLCWDKSSSSGLWVVVAFPKSGLALYRPGDKTWSHAGRYWRFADAELHNGQLYAITLGGILSTIDVSSSSFNETVLVSSPPFPNSQNLSFHLVSSKDLLLVVRTLSGRTTTGLEVFKLNSGELGWTPVTKLSTEVVFLGGGSSAAVPAMGLEGFEGNCVWFIEEGGEEEEEEEEELMCYGLESGEINRAGFGEGERMIGCWPSSAWVIPCLW